jgi:hypothetical protein
MARVIGVQECLHYPLYDAFFLPKPDDNGKPTFKEAMVDPNVIRFFVDVQNKTRLETNMQAAGVLPSQNTFEARALRVVISTSACADLNGVAKANPGAKGDVGAKGDPSGAGALSGHYAESDSFIPELIYNSVITFLVGEKEAITAPTYMFPSGAGVFGGNGTTPPNHGEPDPRSTFSFAEPMKIGCQQNFRVEMSFPRGVPHAVACSTGPRHITVLIDGYLTRDVQ